MHSKHKYFQWCEHVSGNVHMAFMLMTLSHKLQTYSKSNLSNIQSLYFAALVYFNADLYVMIHTRCFIDVKVCLRCQVETVHKAGIEVSV